MWMPSSHVWVSPLAESTSSAPTIASIEATAGQKRCRMVIADPQDSNRRLRPGGQNRGSHVCPVLVYTGTDETLSWYSLLLIPILNQRVLRGSQPLPLCLPNLPTNV